MCGRERIEMVSKLAHTANLDVIVEFLADPTLFPPAQAAAAARVRRRLVFGYWEDT